MGLTPLSDLQQDRLDALVVAGRLRAIPADSDLAAKCIALADERLSDLSVIRTTTVRMSTAYDAARDFDQTRRTRNNQNCRAAFVGERPAADVERITQALREAATRAGISG